MDLKIIGILLSLIFIILEFWSVLWELDQSLRAKTKYAPDNLPQDKYDAYQEIRDELRELMSDNNVNFDMVK